MAKLTYAERQDMVNDYADLSNQTAEIYNESYRNLSNALLTAASIYMAVIAAIVVSKESIAFLPFWCVILIGISAFAFLVSIVFGVISHMHSVGSSVKMYKVYKKVARALVKTDAISEHKAALDMYEKYSEGFVDKAVVTVQLVSFIIGAILLMPPFYVVLIGNWLCG